MATRLTKCGRYLHRESSWEGPESFRVPLSQCFDTGGAKTLPASSEINSHVHGRNQFHIEGLGPVSPSHNDRVVPARVEGGH